jgi:glyoxylase-like metal-dependent hydrolase (beta-lactamase superfamily II)
MARAPDNPGPRGDFDPETGALVEVVPGIARVTAPNAGPFTYTGTNTFLVGVDRLVVIDPGPSDKRHLKALLKAIDGRPVDAILLTHTHRDHSGLARRLKKKIGAPIWFSHPHRLYREATWLERRALARSCDFTLKPDEELQDGDTVMVDGIGLSAIATPGHCENHLAFSVASTPYLFIGDHVMGWSSTVVAPPDGAMAPYLQSLEKVIVSPFSHYLPGHGGPIPEGRKAARALLAHRHSRNDQILEGIASGARTPGKLVTRIYQDLSPALLPAARKTVEAHLAYLTERGDIALRRTALGMRYERLRDEAGG